MIRTNIYLTLRQIEFLRLIRVETGIPVAEIIRRLLDEEIEKRKTVPDTGKA